MTFVSASFQSALALCAAAALAAPGMSTAAELASVPVVASSGGSLTAAQHFALKRAQMATPRQLTIRSDNTLDANPPELKAFSAGTFVNATADIPQLRVDFTAIDDDSGVYYLTLEATGPDGQKKFAQAGPQFPSRKMQATLAINFGRNDQPGLWTITDVEVGDDAGNFHDYTAKELAALGNTRFKVWNSYAKYLDNTPPVLASGKVLSPVVSLTAGGVPIRTTVGVELHATDAGNPAPTGVHLMDVFFCTLTGGNCFEMQEFDSVETNPSTTLRPATSVNGGQYPPGDYYVYYVHLIDWGSNERYVVAKEFGGDTDFSTLFPAGHKITLLP